MTCTKCHHRNCPSCDKGVTDDLSLSLGSHTELRVSYDDYGFQIRRLEAHWWPGTKEDFARKYQNEIWKAIEGV